MLEMIFHGLVSWIRNPRLKNGQIAPQLCVSTMILAFVPFSASDFQSLER
jgi:hypothetical protein